MKFNMVETLARSYSIRKRLTALGVMLTKLNVPLELNIDGGSYTDGRKIVIGVPKKLTEKMLKKGLITNVEQVLSIFKGLTVHEAEHVRSSSFILVKKFNETVEKDYQAIGIRGAGKVIGQGILNGVEDGRIERRAINRLPGVGKHIRFMNVVFHQLVGHVEQNPLRDFLLSLCTIATSNLYLDGWSDEYEDTEFYKLLEDCVPFVKIGVAAETPEECYDACMEIHKLSFPVLKKHIEDNKDDYGQQSPFAQDGDMDKNPNMDNADRKDAPGNKQQQYSNEGQPGKPGKGSPSGPGSQPKDKKPGKGSGINSDEEDDSKDKDSSGGDSEKDEDNKDENEDSKDGKSDKSKSSDDEDKPKELTPQELADLIKEINEAIYDENTKNVADAIKEDAQNAKEEAARKAKRAKNRLTPKELKEISRNHTAEYREFDSREPLDSRSKERSKELEKTILRILRNKKSEELRFRRSGNIDKRSYVRFVMNKENDVFFKAEKNEIDDAAFYILIDHSGSMKGQNMALALTSASVIQDAIQQHCPLRVVGFNSGGRSTQLYDYKDFDDKKNGSLIKFVNNSSNANCDSYAIHVATKELSKRSEKTKILFVLSDGYPTVSIEQDAIIDSKNAVIEARKKGIIVIPIVFGVDSCDRNNFETIYEKNIVMCQPVDIEKNLSKLLEKIIKTF